MQDLDANCYRICSLSVFRIGHIIRAICAPYVAGACDGLREYFSQTDERATVRRIPVMDNMAPVPSASKKTQKIRSTKHHHRSASLDVIYAANKNAVLMEEYSDEDEECQFADQEASPSGGEFEHRRTASEDETQGQIDLSIFSGNIPVMMMTTGPSSLDSSSGCWVSSGVRSDLRLFCMESPQDPRKLSKNHLFEGSFKLSPEVTSFFLKPRILSDDLITALRHTTQLVDKLWFSFLSRTTSSQSSSRCLCFRIRDLRADSRFDIILLFLLLSMMLGR